VYWNVSGDNETSGCVHLISSWISSSSAKFALAAATRLDNTCELYAGDHVHVIIFVPLRIFMLYSSPSALYERTGLCVSSELVHLVLAMGDVREVAGVDVKKAVAFLYRRVQLGARCGFWERLRQLPVIGSSFSTE